MPLMQGMNGIQPKREEPQGSGIDQLLAKGFMLPMRFFKELGRGTKQLAGEYMGGMRDQVKTSADVIHRGMTGQQVSPPEVMNMMTNLMMMGGGRGQVKAYHGSPHRFDKFKSSAIGTGEGAQAFGHGLYFTDKKGVADTYANALSRQIEIDGVPLLTQNRRGAGTTGNEALDTRLIAMDGDIAAVVKDLEDLIPKVPASRSELPKDMLRIAKELKERNAITTVNQGQVYAATIHKGKTPDQYDYLRWDEKVSANKVLEKVKTVRPEDTASYRELVKVQGTKVAEDFKPAIHKRQTDAVKFLADHVDDSGLTGRELYEGLAATLKGKQAASDFLLRAGIDGIKYPSGSLSGVKNSKSFNYVVFDENAITIEKILDK